MPEERILLDKLERARPDDEASVEEPDPYTGPNLDVVRGLRKAAWRLYVFYGPFAPAVIAGVVLVLQSTRGAVARWVAVWALAYLVLNLASGGLPGPNLVRYNKDLELVAPLCCVALASVGGWLGRRGRGWVVGYGLGYVMFALARAVHSLTGTFVLER
jgi:hypothetical protein